jgi:hypothetical protein
MMWFCPTSFTPTMNIDTPRRCLIATHFWLNNVAAMQVSTTLFSCGMFRRIEELVYYKRGIEIR